MDPKVLRACRARAVNEARKSSVAQRRERWDAALRHNRRAAEALERAVAFADHDDDRLLLAGVLSTGALIRELSGDGQGAVSAARAALRMYEIGDRDAADPTRIPLMLRSLADKRAYLVRGVGAVFEDMAVHPQHGPLKGRFEEIYAMIADAQLTLARLVAEHEAGSGDAEAWRLAAIGLESYRALVSAGDRYSTSDLERVSAQYQAVLDRLGGSSDPPTAAELAQQAKRDRETKEADLRHVRDQAESLASTAQDHYNAGRFADAVDTMRQAVTRYREVAADSLWHKRELARALYYFAHHLEGNGKRAAAVAVMHEAWVLFRQVLEQQDSRFVDEVVRCRRELRRLRLVRLRLRPRATRVPPLW